LKSNLVARNKESTGFPRAQNEGPTNDTQLFASIMKPKCKCLLT